MLQSNFSDYQIKIKKEEFITPEGIRFSKTAEISFNYEGKMDPVVKCFGFIDHDDLFQLLDKQEDLNISNCYVKNFSLSDYREFKKFDEKHVVKLNKFKATNSLFESHHETDFSYAEFSEGGVDFSNSYFALSPIAFHNSVFKEGKIDFSGTQFINGNINFSNTIFEGGEMLFQNTVFKEGYKNFQFASFGKGEVNFNNIEFGDGNVSFINTHFEAKKVSFKLSRFGNGVVDFHFARFSSKEISFERTEFSDGSVIFKAVEFGKGKVNFNRAVFGKGQVDFEGSEFNNGKFTFKGTYFDDGDINFSLLEFSGSDLVFDKAEFGNSNIIFTDSKINLLSLQSCHIDQYVDLKVSEANIIDLSNSVVRDVIDLDPAGKKMHIKTIKFVGAKLLGRIYINWYTNQVKELIYNQEDSDYWAKADQFRVLKENFHSNGQYDDEDLSYVEFKRNEGKAILIDNVKKSKFAYIIAYPRYWFEKLLFDQMGLYATSPLRVLISMAFVYVFFALLYVFVPMFVSSAGIQSGVGNPDNLNGTQLGFYHAAITFFTIGYGDTYPVGLLKIVAALEGFCGVFMTSYFVVAFVRKILR